MALLKFRLDPAGFPMLWIDTINAYMHWLPVTKIQFEHFLCSVPDSHFDATWYEEVLGLNSRVSPGGIRSNNYWNAFLTGIRPSEVQQFVRWCGEGYAIPTLEEWFKAYTALKDLPIVSPNAAEQVGDIRERARQLVARIEAATPAAFTQAGYIRTLADQMLLRMGVFEWVEYRYRDYEWGGMGETNSRFYARLSSPDDGKPMIPNNPEGTRLMYYGFRLIWREV